jgi:ABC-2 type transport system permease protein
VVAHVLRLRFALLLGALRAGPGERARTVAVFLAVVVGVVVVCAGITALGAVSTEAAFVVTVLGGSAIAVGYALASPISGTADQLDPRRFATLGLAPRPLAGAILLAGVVSVPMLALAAVAVAIGAMWAARGAGAAAVVGPLLAFLTCLLLARVGAAVGALFGGHRRSRELTGLFILALLVIVVPVGVFFASLDWGDRVPSPLAVAARVLSYTPVGAAWALPGAALTGDAAALWGAAAVAVVTVGLLALAWFALVGRALRTIDRPTVGRERGGMGWFAVTPGTAGGAIAARSLTYWLRDRRYGVNILVVPVAALLTTVPLVIAGVPPTLVALVPVPIIALFFGWLPHNDVAYDSTAVWLHIASGVRGISDRVGRLVPILLIGIPTFAVAVPLAIAINGRWAHLPALVGVTASLFLAGLGLSSIASVAAPYAVSRPGDSPFQQPQRTGSAGIAGQAFVMIGTLVVSAPTLWWAWLAVSQDPAYGLAALVAGIATGLVVLGIGLAVGSALFERRSGALMEFVEAVY